MHQQTKRAVANALDNALTTVAIREYNRLAYMLSPDYISECIVNALNSLGSLGSGNMPDYDEWDALFYNWYQPSQINLGYSMLKSVTGVSEKLYVIDFGCGALAMQFGIALAVADELEQMRTISEIRIDSLDTSQEMLNMGEKIWTQFKVEVNKDSRLRYISLACEIINSQTNPLSSEYSRNGIWATSSGASCWVNSMHAVYEDNRDNVQRILNTYVSGFNPDICFATTHSSKGDLMGEVWDFIDYDEYYLPELTIESQFSGMLPEITQWRRNLNTALQINHRYLNRPVTWEWPEAVFMIHAKGPMPMDADDLPW